MGERIREPPAAPETCDRTRPAERRKTPAWRSRERTIAASRVTAAPTSSTFQRTSGRPRAGRPAAAATRPRSAAPCDRCGTTVLRWSSQTSYRGSRYAGPPAEWKTSVQEETGGTLRIAACGVWRLARRPVPGRGDAPDDAVAPRIEARDRRPRAPPREVQQPPCRPRLPPCSGNSTRGGGLTAQPPQHTQKQGEGPVLPTGPS